MDSALTYPHMGRPKTPSLPTDVIGQIFRDRVLELMPRVFPRARNETEQIKALASRSGVGGETIRAALKGERSPRLVAVDAIARALGLSISELFSTAPREPPPPPESGSKRPFPTAPSDSTKVTRSKSPRISTY